MKTTYIYTNSLVTLRAWINRLDKSPSMRIDRINYNWYVLAIKNNGDRVQVEYNPSYDNFTRVVKS